jgi:hypothetical protein
MHYSSFDTRDMIQGSIELYVMVTGVAVAGLALRGHEGAPQVEV